jgi:hypothetical protein
MRTLAAQGAAFILSLAPIANAAVPTTSHRLPENVPPDIGAWFWESLDDFKPGQYKTFVDLVADHSPFRVLTTSQRVPKEVTDPEVHELVKAAAAYARQRGLVIAYDLDIRLAREAFHKQYPDEMQEMLRIREADLSPAGDTQVSVPSAGGPKDHMTWGSKASYYPMSGRLARVYSYVRGADGIEPETVRDITNLCRVAEA